MRGYIALTTVLIISFIILSVGLASSLLSVGQLQNSLSGKKYEQTINLLESCVEDSLIRLNKSMSIPSLISIPGGTCSVTIDSQTGNTWIFTVSTNFDGYSKSIQIEAIRDTKVSVVKWNEL